MLKTNYKNTSKSTPTRRWITCFMFLLGMWTTSAWAQTFTVVGSGTASNGATGYPAPYGNYYYGARHQFFVTGAQMTSAGIGANSNISSLGFNVTATNSANPHQGFQVKVYNVGSTANPISAGYVSSTLVAQSTATTITPSVGWIQITFNSAFLWNGTDNLVIETCFNNTGYNNNASTQWTTTGLGTGTWSRWYRADASGVCANTSTTSTSTSTRPNMRFEWTSSGGCSGTPAPGNTIASPTAVCPSQSFNLSLQNSTSGSGVTYQWYSSPDNVSYSSISGATSSTYSSTQSSNTYYKCEVTCAGSTGTSTAVQVTMNTDACVCNTYCTASATCDEAINSFSFNTITNSGTGCSGGYASYTGMSTTVQQGQSYPVSITTTLYYGGDQAYIWIDYNGNGTFDDATESTALTYTGSGGVFTATVTIPYTANVGGTRLRARMLYSTYYGACGVANYGEAEDYCVNITPAPACTGTPAPGNTLSSAALACSGQTFTLSLQNQTIGTGVTYNWQSSPDGVTWTSTGGTSNTYTTSQTSATYYQCVVTCGPSSSSGTSTALQVNMNAFYNCYCTSGLGGSCSINSLSSVSIATTTLNNVTGGCTGTYNSFPASGSTTASLVAGAPYNMTAGCISGSNTQVAIWIDANQNGIFETSEYTLINGNIPSGGTGSGSFTIPVTALPGTTGMRVRSDWQGTTAWTSADACTNRTWGETEDYTITVLIPGNCAGTPASSVTTASVTSLCPGGSVSLGTNPVYSDAGLTFDWQSSPDGVTYTSMGVTTPTQTVSGFSATTWYQCVITCTNGGSPITSTPIQVNLNPFYNCYCTSSLQSSNSPCIEQIDFNTLSNSTAGDGCPLPAYSLQPGTTTVYQGFSYTFTRIASGTGAWTGIWIDYNHSGTFDASEYTQLSTTGTGTLSNSISITIPMSALTGNTGMRVRQRVVDMTSTDACTQNFGSGETEDYVVDIQTPAGCTGTPAPGSTVSSTGSLACSGQSFTLSIPGLTVATGLSYQWYSSPDGVTYAAVSGATNNTLTTAQTATTYYYCAVTCANSGLTGNSTALMVGMNTYINCYCTPNSQFGTSGGFYGVISNVTFNTLNNSSSYPTTTPYFTNYAPSGLATTTVTAGASYTLDVTSGFYNYAGAWFDWDQDGTFSASEYVDLGVNSTGSTWIGSQLVTVPTGAVAGTTKMRIRTEYYGYTLGSTDACTLLFYGESEDYTITVNPAVVCSGNPASATTTSTANPVCPGINFTLSPSSLYTESGLTYDWQSSSDGVTYTSTGVTTQQYTVSQSAATYYQLVVTCTNSGLSTTTTPLQITMNSVANCYCVAGATTDGFGTSNEYVGNVTLNTINNTSTNPAAPANQYSDFTSISTSLQIGNTYTGSVLIPNWFGGDQAAIWIDFNQDGSFNTTTEQFLLTLGGGDGFTPLTGDITIPGTALTGSTRMRVRGNYTGAMSPCGITTYGEVEDYTVNIASPTCVLSPTYPSNGTNGCPDGTNINLSWPALSGATGYDVYVGTTNPPTTLVSSNQVGTSFNADVSGFAPTYYWMVVPQISGGGVSCTVWSFGLNPAPEAMATTGGDPCSGGALALSGDNTAAGQTSGNTYQWSGPASFNSTQQNPVRSNAIATYAGTYTLTVTNQFLCTATTTVDVAVNPNPTLSVVSSVNVGCIGGSDGEMTVVGNTTGPFDYTTDFVSFNQDGYFTGLPTGSTTYYVSDAFGCTGTGAFNLTYTSTTPPSANVIVPFVGMPSYVCSGTSAVISIPAVSNTTKYIWDAPSGSYFNGNPLNVSPFTTTSPSVQVTYGNPSGSLYVTGVQAANGCGASLRKIQKSRGIVSVPSGIAGATTVCASATGTYTTPAVDAATSYEWDITGNATVTGTGTTATVTFGPGWTGGTLCVAAKTPCYKSPPKCITLGTSASQVNALTGTFTACPNQTLSYSVAPSAGAASYNWTLPSGATGTSTTNNISVAYGAGYSAVGSICVSVTSLCGVTSAQKCKTVAPGLPAQPASISGALSGVCNQTIVYSTPVAGSGVTYTWSVPSGAAVQSGQGSPNISALFGSLSTGGVCVTASTSCGSSTARCVTVKGAPNSPSSITAVPSSWCANTPGVEFTVNTSAMTGGYTLNWAYPPASVATYVFGGGNSSTLILDWISGSGAVNVTASNGCGAATKPSSWSSTCRESEVGVVNALNVSPNPTTGILNINYTATKGHTQIIVLDLAGRVVMTQNANSIEGNNNTQLDMSRLAKGAYMLSVQSTQGNKQVRVVVE